MGQTTPPAVADSPAPIVVLGKEPFAVGAFRTELTADDKVGRRQAGLICGPAGALRWRDVEPAAGKASGAAARAIRAAGVTIDAPDADDWLDYRPPASGYRLIGDVDGVEASACAPAYGIGRRVDHDRRLKGEGRMRVDWRIYRLADHQVVAHTRTCAAFSFDRAGMTTTDIGQLGIIENARILGVALSRSPGSFRLPDDLTTDSIACPRRATGHRTPDGESAP